MKKRRLGTVTMLASTVRRGAGRGGTAVASTKSTMALPMDVLPRMEAVTPAAAGRAQARPGFGRELIAAWNMNEQAGSTVMRDASGNGLDGRIGREVGVAQTGGTGGYRFSRLQPDTPPTH